MTTFARIAGGLATDVTDTDPFEIFHPTLAAQFYIVPDNTVNDEPLEAAGLQAVLPPAPEPA